MLTGAYKEYQLAVMTFTTPVCDHADGGHVASCIVTLYASAGGSVLITQTARLPVAEHMVDADVLAMFQQQFNSLPEYGAMAPV